MLNSLKREVLERPYEGAFKNQNLWNMSAVKINRENQILERV